MFNHNVAYRFKPSPGAPEGFLEGFSGCGFSKEAARANAIKKIKFKLEFLKQPFKESSLIENQSDISPLELQFIKEDWKISQHSEVI